MLDLIKLSEILEENNLEIFDKEMKLITVKEEIEKSNDIVKTQAKEFGDYIENIKDLINRLYKYDEDLYCIFCFDNQVGITLLSYAIVDDNYNIIDVVAS